MLFIRKNNTVTILVATVFFLSGAFIHFSCSKKNKTAPDFSKIKKGFQSPPDSVQTSIYWYWISDNISKEGVVKDLESMKRVGINRAFIGNIGLESDGMPSGKVKIFSDEWWEILHTALKTATKLGIEIGIFNSPGWSQSGGPWVKPEQSMRYLATSETKVKGPGKVIEKLPQPSDFFQDVNVIAYPVNEMQSRSGRVRPVKATSKPGIPDIERLTDGDVDSAVALPIGESVSIDFEYQSPHVIRSILIKTATKPAKLFAEVFAKEGNQFRLLTSFEIDRSNPRLIVGFDPYGPVVMSLPETNSKTFRVVFSRIAHGSSISEINLSAIPLQERYVEKTLAKMFQTPLPYWNEYLWPDQPVVSDKSLLIDPDHIIDISGYMDADGTLTWDVPEGEWKIIRAGMASTNVKNEPATPEGTGLEIDKMSKEHVAAHFDAFLGEIIRRIPPADRKTWKVVVQDSYERGGQNWTDDFVKQFTIRYGYDPVKFIPVFRGEVVGSRDISDRFLWDLRRLVADKVAYDYVGGLRDVSHQNGMTTWLENYGHWGFPGEFLQYGGQSDEIGGEFWSEGDLGNIENRAASSCAHIYGKQKVSAESFTCGGRAFSRYPAMMKQRGDRFFCEGINNTLLHVYIQQAYEDREPGMNAPFGNEFNRKNTWYNDMDMFISYLKRCNFMLQQGNYVADVAYFIGEDVPKMTGICDPLLPLGYSFDYINAEVIQTRISVRDGKLVLPDGMQYSMLVLPQLETMRPELLLKITELVEQGAVVFGPAPKRSPSLQNYPEADKLVGKLAENLWGKLDGEKVQAATIGKGMVISGMALQAALDLAGVKPDCRLNDNDPVLFIHRRLANGEIYFLSNQSEQTIGVSPEFNVAGKQPELWDPVSGTARNLPEFTSSGGKTVVPLQMEANQSMFIVFNEAANAPFGARTNFPKGKIEAEISTPWQVKFSPAQRGPAHPVTMEKLQDWSSFTNDSIRFYSGTAVYSNSFELPAVSKGNRTVLNLGKLTALGKVRINGKQAGGAWTPPWQVDITDFVKKGKNTVDISMVNTWVNRLIGDSFLHENDRPTWCPVNPYKPASPLQPSGLLGPVNVISVNY